MLQGAVIAGRGGPLRWAETAMQCFDVSRKSVSGPGDLDKVGCYF